MRRAVLIAVFGSTSLVRCGRPAPEPSPPTTQATVSPIAADTECPSFEELGRQVDERVKSIKPGVSLKEFTTAGPARYALNFWDDVPGGLRETVFFVSVSDGNSVVSDEVVCRFNRDDILVSCKRECCRGQSRSITLEQYKALQLGESRVTVERRLCTPSDSERKSAGRVTTYYHIPLPVGHHDEGQTVMLVFDNGALSSKGMSPYY